MATSHNPRTLQNVATDFRSGVQSTFRGVSCSRLRRQDDNDSASRFREGLVDASVHTSVNLGEARLPTATRLPDRLEVRWSLGCKDGELGAGSGTQAR